MAKKIEKVNDGSGRISGGYNKIETWDAENIEELSAIYYRVLELIGEDPTREGLVRTPSRVAKAMNFLTNGYNMNAEEILKSAMFKEEYKQMVIVKDIDLYSMCEHHMLPFYGKAHVAYIPNDRIIGISKLARLVDMYARRLQIQERIGQQVTDALMLHLNAKGAACIIEATHMCMRMRGVAKQESIMSTSSLQGAFFTSAGARIELMGLIKS